MKRAGPWILLAALFLGQGLLRPSVPQTPDLGQAFRGTVDTVLLGAVRPLMVQYLWWHLEVALADDRVDAALRDLALISRFDRDNPRAAIFAAQLMGVTLAAREQRAGDRLLRLEDGIRWLDDAERRFPGHSGLPRLRAELIWYGVDPSLYRAWTERHGETPLAAALAAIERGLTLNPTHPDMRRLAAEIGRARALELWIGAGDRAGGAGLLTAARRLDDGTPGAERTLGAIRIRGWEGLARGLEEERAPEVVEGIQTLQWALLELPPPEEGESVPEDRLILAILREVLDLGQSVLDSGEPGAALSLVTAVHNIRAVIEGRLAKVEGGLGEFAEGRAQLRTLARRLLDHAPSLGDRIPAALLR